MRWYRDFDKLMALVDRARSNPELLHNHLEGVLPKLVTMRDKHKELIEAFFGLSGEEELISKLESELPELEKAISFYEGHASASTEGRP